MNFKESRCLRRLWAAVRMRGMKRIRRVLLFTTLAILTIGGWLWWIKPIKVDMAIYAPATSLLYLESNRPLEVVESIAATDAWKVVEKASGMPGSPRPNRWLQSVVGWTGIGPIQSVILARAQVAVVVTDLG